MFEDEGNLRMSPSPCPVRKKGYQIFVETHIWEVPQPHDRVLRLASVNGGENLVQDFRIPEEGMRLAVCLGDDLQL
jgi:hypothetical protein